MQHLKSPSGAKGNVSTSGYFRAGESHPVTHEREVDVELGKHWIDVLGMLEKKTAGNLTPQEKRMLESLLSDLRMQYVSLANSSQFGRKFTGSDITGGR